MAELRPTVVDVRPIADYRPLVMFDVDERRVFDVMP